MLLPVEFANFEHRVRILSVNYGEQSINAVTLGPGSYLVSGSLEFGSIDCHVLIGRYSSLGHRIHFLIGLNHNGGQVTTYPFKDLMHSNNDGILNHYFSTNRYQIIIGNDVWIGCDATILGGVRIGNGAIIGAGTVVSRNVPPYAVVVGNPARIVKYRFKDDICKKLQEIKWWNWTEREINSNLELMANPKLFVEKFYQKEWQSEDGVCKQLKKLSEAGDQLFAFVADVGVSRPLWKKVVHQFISFVQRNNRCVLLLGGIETDSVAGKWIEHYITDAGLKDKWRIVLLGDIRRVLKDFVINVDAFITTREDLASQCVDFASGCGVKILSALDYDIFECGYDGEMYVDFGEEEDG